MRELRLVAVSDDGGKLLLRGDAQEPEFTLRIDERLHAAIRGDRPRLGQLEIQLDNELRPRDIQARVRAGESAESLALASGLPLDRVMRYAGPVIAEREHMVERARKCVVRRSSEGQFTLADTVTTAFEARRMHDDELEWDAWRGDDGRWAVRAAWTQTEGETVEPYTATWVLDPAGRSVSALDEFSRWLGGEQPYPAPPEPVAPAVSRLAVVRRLGEPVAADSGALDGSGDGARPTPEDLRAGAVDAEDDRADHDPADDAGPERVVVVEEHVTVQLEPLEPAASADPEPASTRARPREPHRRSTTPKRASIPSHPASAPRQRPEADTGRLRLSDIAQHIDEAPVAESAPAARKNRASVPSWDEIMFGKRRRGE